MYKIFIINGDNKLNIMNINFLKRHAIVIISSIISLFLLERTLNVLLSHKQAQDVMPVEQASPVKKPSKNVSEQYTPLFGEFIPSLKDPNAIPNTLLNLSLIGIIKASDAKNSQALISVSQQEEKLYSIGDNLPGGAKLIRILDDAILLKHDDKIEKLSLPKDPLNFDDHEPPLQLNEE
jgi:general secretion pathway protein C